MAQAPAILRTDPLVVQASFLVRPVVLPPLKSFYAVALASEEHPAFTTYARPMIHDRDGGLIHLTHELGAGSVVRIRAYLTLVSDWHMTAVQVIIHVPVMVAF